MSSPGPRSYPRLTLQAGIYFAVFLSALLAATGACAQQKGKAPAVPGSGKSGSPASTAPAGGTAGAQGGESKSSPSAAPKESATGSAPHLSPLDPSPAPPKAFSRPRIGLALGGGGAVALTEVGVLEWFEEHHIPVDVIAGTSMGCMVSALYSTGRKPEQLKRVVNNHVFTSVFSFTNSYNSRSFRRREEARELPNALTIGLKHRVSFRNSVLVDQGLNAFLDREFLRYDDLTDFNTLPIPLRCLSTDLNDAKAVTFARGSIPDAVRASVSLPGVYRPFELNGHEYVDGGVLENLPTATVRSMNADVVLAVSIPLPPVAKGELSSILSVLGRSFSVAIEATEREQRKLADVVILPDITGFGAADYLKSVDLAERGYDATEAQRDALMRYAVSDDDWAAYLAHRESLVRGPAGPVLRVRVTAPDQSATAAIQRLFGPLVNQPVDTVKIEALLDQVRADGGYDADYTVGYESPQQFAAQTSGVAPLPSGTVAVAAATSTDQVAAPVADAKVTAQKAPGAPNAKPETASASSNQAGGTQAGVAKVGAVAPAAASKEPTVSSKETPAAANAARPGAPGLSATRTVTAESLADIATRPIILVTVTPKKTGPPYLLAGVNLQAQTTAFTRATLEGAVLDQNFLRYGSELRTNFKLGYLTELSSEYYHPLNPLSAPQHTVFVAPRISLLRQPFPIYVGHHRVADRQFQRFGFGGDVGWTNQRNQEVRAGVDFSQISWNTAIGTDGQPDFSGNSQRARVRYDYDAQDRALVPQFGVHFTGEAGYLYSSVASESAPQLYTRTTYAHRFSLHKFDPTAAPDPNRGHEVFVMAAEGGTMFNRNVGAPFRYTLGGPLRMSASAIDQYRGTDYFLVEPALLRRIAQLPQPLGESIYLGLGVEYGQISGPGMTTIRRQDAYFGVVAETPLGVITFAPAIGSNGERKFIFTLGRLF
jgi:NTE family protein